MLNRYPLWKYIMLVAVIIVGLFYSLPTLYGEDPAIQISGLKQTKVTLTTQDKVRQVLEKNGIDIKSMIFDNNSLLVRVGDEETQSKAQSIITDALGNNYAVAPNLAPVAPAWFSYLGAQPIKKGLDLRGGVYFLMEVDMAGLIEKRTELLAENLKTDFKSQKIDFSSITNNNKQQIIINLTNSDDRNAAMARLRMMPDFEVVSQTDDKIIAIMSPARLQETKNEAVQQNTTIIRNRVNQLGVAEPIVQRQGSDRIVVQLPGIQDTVQAKQVLGATATLEFRPVNTTNVDYDAILSGQTKPPYGSQVYLTSDGRPILLYNRIILTGDHISDSTARANEYGMPEVSISLDSAGGKKMFDFTQKNVGKLMATLFVEYKNSGKVDETGKPILEKREEVINAATIQGIFSDRFQVTGIGSIEEARRLSLLLRAGALIAPIQIIEENVIGPSMGQERIEQGLQSCLWGLIVTVIFMLVCYRLFGIFASIAVSLNLILIVAIMSLIPGATLTMPGIAGIVLTVGMAVDANVLINERIKEELRNGRSPQHAINEGYAGAWTSIFDANITTLITAVILYAAGTGSIKGFAITLGIGVLTSMFTSIIGTRALANLVYGGRRVKKLSI